jgi:hypothetical protein
MLVGAAFVDFIFISPNTVPRPLASSKGTGSTPDMRIGSALDCESRAQCLNQRDSIMALRKTGRIGQDRPVRIH